MLQLRIWNRAALPGQMRILTRLVHGPQMYVPSSAGSTNAGRPLKIGNTLNLRSLCVCLIKSPLFHEMWRAQQFRCRQNCGWALSLKSSVAMSLVKIRWDFLTEPGTSATSRKATICKPDNTPDTSFRYSGQWADIKIYNRNACFTTVNACLWSNGVWTKWIPGAAELVWSLK